MFTHLHTNSHLMGFPGGTMVKNLTANAGDLRDAALIPGMGRSLGGGHGSPLQCSCLENPMDSRAWRVTGWGRKESDTMEVAQHLCMQLGAITRLLF